MMTRARRRVLAAGLAGVLLLGGAGAARAQMTGGVGGGGGGLTGGGGGGGGGGGLTGGGVLSNQVTGGASGGFLTGTGQMVAASPTNTTRTSNFFNFGSNNPFALYYTNPLSMGLNTTTSGSRQIGSSIGGPGGGQGTGQWGTPLFSALANNANTAGAMPGVSGNIRGPGMANASTGRVPAYATTIDFAVPVTTPTQLQLNLQAMLARSSSLPGASIRVALDGPTVVLQGTVLNDRQQRLAENMIRLTPGVRAVRNELRIR